MLSMNTASDNNQLIHLRLSAGGAHTKLVLGHAVLARAADFLSNYRASRLLLVSDERVAPLYAAPLCNKLVRTGYDAHLLTMAVGEEAKTLETLIELYRACQSLHVERSDTVVAVGGGVVGDVAGMLAGAHPRGVGVVPGAASLVAV